MYASSFAQLDQTQSSSALSGKAASRHALNESVRRTHQPARARFASRLRRVAPHFTRGEAHSRT